MTNKPFSANAFLRSLDKELGVTSLAQDHGRAVTPWSEAGQYSPGLPK